MSNPKSSFGKRLLRRERAAAYLDISPGTFDRLVREGKLPPPKMLEGIRIWDVRDLDARADELLYDASRAPETEKSALDSLLGF
jgi:predicted DNA-binding transcriptional regulator AlpA